MRWPSEDFLSSVLTFPLFSSGGFLDPPPKYMSYSTFSRRSWSSSTLSSSSIAKGVTPFPGAQRSGGERLGGIYHRLPWPPTCSRYRDSPHQGALSWAGIGPNGPANAAQSAVGAGIFHKRL